MRECKKNDKYHEIELHKITKDIALRPQYAQYPNPKPELFCQTRPELDLK